MGQALHLAGGAGMCEHQATGRTEMERSNMCRNTRTPARCPLRLAMPARDSREDSFSCPRRSMSRLSSSIGLIRLGKGAGLDLQFIFRASFGGFNDMHVENMYYTRCGAFIFIFISRLMDFFWRR